MVDAILDAALRFHFRIDADGRVAHAAPGLAKLMPDIVGQRLSGLLAPECVPRDGQWRPSPQMYSLLFLAPSVRLRAEFVSVDDGDGLVGLAILDPDPEHELASLGLDPSDFSALDLTLEFNMLRWSRDSQIAETRQALERLRASTALSESLRVKATTDYLTKIANRAHFMEVLEEAMQTDTPVEILMIDLDRFKSVNDLHGHHVGDEMLEFVAGRLARIVAEDALAARLGGDEFGIVVLGPAVETMADRIATEVAALNGLEMHAPGAHLTIQLTVGRVRRTIETEAGALVRHADIAMYGARKTAGVVVGVFDPADQRELTIRRSIANDLQAAIAAGQLTMHYQPIIALGSGDIVGHEALSRWTHPIHGPLRPDVFVEVAEHCNLVEELDRFAVTTAVRAASERLRGAAGALKLSVNLSPMSLTEGLVDLIADTLAENRFEPARFIVEVTETASILDLDRTTRILGRLEQLGVVIALDDFGTGFSSLTHLHLLPIGELKVDRSFVMEMLESRRALEVVRTILHVASSFELPVVAEGIETAEQAQLLTNLGCGFGQGYHFGRPVPLDEAAERLQDRMSSTHSRARSAVDNAAQHVRPNGSSAR